MYARPPNQEGGVVVYEKSKNQTTKRDCRPQGRRTVAGGGVNLGFVLCFCLSVLFLFCCFAFALCFCISQGVPLSFLK